MTEMRTGCAARPTRSSAKCNTDSARDSFGQSGTTRSSTSISLILHPPQVPQELRLPAQLRSAEGEVTAVVLEVLGRVPIDVCQGHVCLEVGIPGGRVAHSPRHLRVTLPIQMTQQLGDHPIEPPSHPRVPEQPWPCDGTEVVDDVERPGR